MTTTNPKQWAMCGLRFMRSAALLAPLLAQAASLEIDPVRIDLTPQHKTAAITIRNNSDQATTIQIKAVHWSQTEVGDLNSDTRDLIAFPPLVKIAPNSAQIVRVALRRTPHATHEVTYRINLEEVPPAPVAGVTSVLVALRIGLPVFVRSKDGKSAPEMRWSALYAKNGDLNLTLRNPGTAHVQVTDFLLMVPGSDAVIAAEQRSSYVLAGQTRTWQFKPSDASMLSGPRIRMKVFTDAGDADQELPLDRE